MILKMTLYKVTFYHPLDMAYHSFDTFKPLGVIKDELKKALNLRIYEYVNGKKKLIFKGIKSN